MIDMIRNIRSIGRLAGILSLVGCDPQGAPPRSPTALRQPVGAAKDGDLTVSDAKTVVNRYAELAADAPVGAVTLTLTASGGAGVDALLPLTAGDLLLVMQMQGADLDSTNTVSYGTVTDLRSAGLYEFVQVSAVDAAAGTVTINAGCGGLRNSYQAAGHAQVIRVPQYGNLKVAAGGSIVAKPWNGSGGVVAVQVSGTVQVDGKIDVTGQGFRGGLQVVHNQTRPANVGAFYYSMNLADGAGRGEGIGGSAAEYLAVGLYGRGAAANGGGGGNRIAAGGGGGANGGEQAQWNGQGVMDLTVQGGTLAWPKDPGYDATRTQFAGGGRGGYTYSGVAQDPTLIGPDMMSWGEDFRRERGGLGGRPVPSAATRRLFLGGGGGAGDDFQGNSGSGGRGGGLVFIDAAQITGIGQILANGESGGAATATSSGAGGGGAGGSIVLTAPAGDGITLQANGGTGGSEVQGTAEAAGPGGGGGGGYIATAAGLTVSSTVSGGSGGTTASTDVTAFPSNGASSGAAGTVDTTVSGVFGGAQFCSAVDLALSLTATPMQATGLDAFHLQVGVQSSGPSPAGQVAVSLEIPSGVRVIKLDAPGWNCTTPPKHVVCTLKSLAAGASSAFRLTLLPAMDANSMAFTGAVTTVNTDPNSANDTVTLAVVNTQPLGINLSGGGLSCSQSGRRSAAEPLGEAVLLLLLAAGRFMRRRVRSLSAPQKGINVDGVSPD